MVAKRMKEPAIKTVICLENGGFSLLELIAVVAILGIISALAIPNITKWIALSRIDAVKTLLNSAAAECLQDVRTGIDPTEASPSESAISNENLSSYGYQIKGTDTKCSSFFAVPANEDDKFMYQLGFKISANGDIVKIAVPASDSGSLNSCKNWAGVNCGVSAEQQAVWDALAKIEKDKKTCNDDFYAWLQKPSSGSYNRWDETTKSCSLETWAFEGSIQRDEAAVKSARDAKLGAACAAKFKAKETAKFDGVFTDPECGTTYFCSGKDLATESKTAYDACKEAERQAKCNAAQGAWISKNENGKFSETDCVSLWRCGTQIIETQSEYDISTCGCTYVSEEYDTGKTEPKWVQECTTMVDKCFPIGSNPCGIKLPTPTSTYCWKDKPIYATRQVCSKK